MKKAASLLISLLLTFSLIAGDPPDLCNSFNDVNQMLPAFYHGQATGDYECFNKIVMQLLAVQTLQANSTTRIIDIAQNDDLSTEQKFDKLCNIFNGISSDFSQTTRGLGFRLDPDLQGTGMIFCEVLSELKSEEISIEKDQTEFVQHFSAFYTTDSVRYDFQKIGNRIFINYSIQIRNISKPQASLKFKLPSSLTGVRFTNVSTMVKNGASYEAVASLVKVGSSFIEFRRINNLKWATSNTIINLTGQMWI